jgi:hypothetical protein
MTQSRKELEVVSFSASISDLAEPAYRLAKAIPVVVRPEGGGYVASFFDANIHASGETDQEAIDNLRTMILDVFDQLTELVPDQLAPVAERQLRVLTNHMGRAA